MSSAGSNQFQFESPLPTTDFYRYEAHEAAFRMYLTPEARERALSVGWNAVRDLVETTFEDVTHDPFGENSIDHNKHIAPGQMERTVHRMSEAAEAAIGLPVAVKGTGLFPGASGTGKRHNLGRQFRLMHKLSSAQRKLYPDGIGGLFFINRPLAYISYPSLDPTPGRFWQEWLLMDRVVGEPVRELCGSGDEQPFFLTGEYPELAAYVTERLPQAVSDTSKLYFGQIAYAAAKDLTGEEVALEHMRDLNGKNLLESRRNDGSLFYTAIDLQTSAFLRLR